MEPDFILAGLVDAPKLNTPEEGGDDANEGATISKGPESPKPPNTGVEDRGGISDDDGAETSESEGALREPKLNPREEEEEEEEEAGGGGNVVVEGASKPESVPPNLKAVGLVEGATVNEEEEEGGNVVIVEGASKPESVPPNLKVVGLVEGANVKVVGAAGVKLEDELDGVLGTKSPADPKEENAG